MYADLQLHSSASDGSDAPAEVVRRAHALGFAAIAITDHDTMSGIAEAMAAAQQLGVDLIPACELSTIDENDRQIDVLAYGVSPEHDGFAHTLRTLRDGRYARAWGMVERLQAHGYRVEFDRVVEIAGGPENIGRPHVAKVMVEAGIVPDVASAFTPDFILEGGRCYVQRVKITPRDAIARIHAAGGLAVVAHPGRTRLGASEIGKLADAGLDGLEAYYPQHDLPMTQAFLELADSLGLLITGGSDDHGDINEGRLMGRIKLPIIHVDRLQRAIARRARGGL